MELLFLELIQKKKFDCEWAAWANGTAVKRIRFSRYFSEIAADYSHPGDNIPPILAVAQQKNVSGKDLIKRNYYRL